LSRAGRGWPAQGHKVRGGTGTNLSNMSKAPRLRCEDNVPLTRASVEAPPRSEGNGPSGEVATRVNIDILFDV
jgi:hypothetical protein